MLRRLNGLNETCSIVTLATIMTEAQTKSARVIFQLS
ncbi:Uncharacterised protein [Vibrio cholerae]|nr:Uncharacterised protein [Vibrio cholerae]